MKETLLLLFSIFSLFSQAQITRIDTVSTTEVNLKPSQFKSQRLYLYTVGVKAFSFEEFPKILNQTNSSDYISTIANGIFLKLNDNQISYRIAANYFSKDLSFKNECDECEEANGKMKDFSTRIGFEKNFVYGVLQPYLAFDLGYRRNSFNGEVKNGSIPGYTTPYDVSTLKNGFLMSPNFGLKLNIVSHFSLAIETGIGILHSYEKQEKTYRDMNRTRTFTDYKKWEFLLKPVSMIGLQYNFGLAY